MTSREIELLFLIHLKGPQNAEQIPQFLTLGLLNEGRVWWMPTDRGRVALTLTQSGESWVKEALELLMKNYGCLGS